MHGSLVNTRQCAQLLPAPGRDDGASAGPSRGCHLKCKTSGTPTEVAQAAATPQTLLCSCARPWPRDWKETPAAFSHGGCSGLQALVAKPGLTPAAHWLPACRRDPPLPSPSIANWQAAQLSDDSHTSEARPEKPKGVVPSAAAAAAACSAACITRKLVQCMHHSCRRHTHLQCQAVAQSCQGNPVLPSWEMHQRLPWLPCGLASELPAGRGGADSAWVAAVKSWYHRRKSACHHVGWQQRSLQDRGDLSARLSSACMAPVTSRSQPSGLAPAQAGRQTAGRSPASTHSWQ